MRMSLGLLFVGNFVFAVFRVQCKMTILVYFMVVTFTERAHLPWSLSGVLVIYV